MSSVFSYAFNAIAPILILAFLGYLLKRKNVFSNDFFKSLNYFVFHYSLPAMMFVNIYGMGSIRDIDYKLAIFMVGSIMVLTLGGLILSNLLTDVKNRKGVMTMAGYRSNFALIGLPLTEGLAGSEGLAIASSMQAPVVVYYNFFSVLFLSIYSDDATMDLKKIGRNILRNPLIRGIAAGVLALIIREFIPLNAEGNLVFSISGTLPWLYTVLTYLSRVATPLALISLGGQFTFSQVSGIRKELTAAVCMRLLLAPLIGFSLTFAAVKIGFIHLSPGVVATLIACYGSPLAVSSVPMSAEMKADAALAGQIVVWTSFLSMFTIFGLTVFFRALGML